MPVHVSPTVPWWLTRTRPLGGMVTPGAEERLQILAQRHALTEAKVIDLLVRHIELDVAVAVVEGGIAEDASQIESWRRAGGH